jgi:hypothetical protein
MLALKLKQLNRSLEVLTELELELILALCCGNEEARKRKIGYAFLFVEGKCVLEKCERKITCPPHVYVKLSV